MIKMKTQYAGPAGTYPPGSTPSFDAATEKALVDGGYAERVASASSHVPPAPQKAIAESASVKPAENAALPPVRRSAGAALREAFTGKPAKTRGR